jgi:hypothetical protein
MMFDLILVPVLVYGIVIALNIHSYYMSFQFESWLIVPNHSWKGLFLFLSLTPVLRIGFVL